eukprot:740344-Amphidinium_carterae.1
MVRRPPCQTAVVERLRWIVLGGNDVVTTIGCLTQPNAVYLLLIVAIDQLAACDWLDACQHDFAKLTDCGVVLHAPSVL